MEEIPIYSNDIPKSYKKMSIMYIVRVHGELSWHKSKSQCNSGAHVHESLDLYTNNTTLWLYRTFIKNQFKNRKGRVALKHLSMMETVVNWWQWTKNANGEGSKKLEINNQPRGVRGTDYKVGTVYTNHAEKNTRFNYMTL
jgi:hypothetical protein